MKGHWAVSILASILILGSLGLSQQAFAVETSVVFLDDSNCDTLFVPSDVHELGRGASVLPTGPFPSDEEISTFTGAEIGPACPSTIPAPSFDVAVAIVNLTPEDWDEVWYVVDDETTISNYDGFVNGKQAFKIDSVGVNTPLVVETATPDGIFESGEIWEFIIDDYVNGLGIAAPFIDSIGVPSPASPPSSGSIIAFHADEVPVGGTIIPIGTTVLLVAGAQTISPWLILGVISAVGIGIAVFTIKRSR